MLLLNASKYLLMLHLFGLYESLLLSKIYIYIEPFYRGIFRRHQVTWNIFAIKWNNIKTVAVRTQSKSCTEAINLK